MTDIVEVLEAVEVVGPTEYRWLGASVHLSPALVRLADPTILRNALVQSLADCLYSDFFTVAGVRPVSAPRGPSQRRLAVRLAEANTGRVSFDTGWTVTGREGSKLVVERSGLRMWVRRADVRGADAAVRDGDVVEVRLGKDLPMLSPGYYMALGERGFALPRPPVLDRFYMHIRVEGATRLMQEATRRLNAADLAFRLKVVDDPDGFDRCDTAVFAFQRRDRHRVLPLLFETHDALSSNFEATVPALTRSLAPGLSFAEDPGGGSSYGADRCAMIARSLVAAFDAEEANTTRRLALVADEFARNGVSLERPHLGPGSPGDITIQRSSTRTPQGRLVAWP